MKFPIFFLIGTACMFSVCSLRAQVQTTNTSASRPQAGRVFQVIQGNSRIVVDYSDAPDLGAWSKTQLAPVLRQWYSKIGRILQSEGYEPPTQVTIEFRDGLGKTPAYTVGDKVTCNIEWFRHNLNGEARGAVVHELVHVVQHYTNPDPKVQEVPGWVVEGIADYMRWYLYEPESKGADISKANVDSARYDASYRTTANFFNWINLKYDKDFVKKLNACARKGKYSDSFWTETIGKSKEELGDEWKKEIEKKVRAL